jgi:hypothetical protein
MTQKQPDYRSYVLRLWREGRADKAVWRASLQNPHAGKRQGFASLEDLFDFLRRRIAVVSVVDGEDSES